VCLLLFFSFFFLFYLRYAVSFDLFVFTFSSYDSLAASCGIFFCLGFFCRRPLRASGPSGDRPTVDGAGVGGGRRSRSLVVRCVLASTRTDVLGSYLYCSTPERGVFLFFFWEIGGAGLGKQPASVSQVYFCCFCLFFFCFCASPVET